MTKYRITSATMVAGRVRPAGSVLVAAEKKNGATTLELERLVERKRAVRIVDPADKVSIADAPRTRLPAPDVVEEEPTDLSDDDEPIDESGPDYQSMPFAALRAEAKSRGIPTPAGTSKASLIKALQAAPAPKPEVAADPIGKWSLDPMTLLGQTVKNLNLMIAERSDGQIGPFDTPEECVAQLSQDFKPAQ